MAQLGERGFDEIFPISALSGEGCDALLDGILARLPESAPLLPEDYLTDQAERSLAAEWIREKLLAETRDELPHATAVLIERWHERDDGLVEIEASVLVERESQKGIVIGRGGDVLKRVGSIARTELEELLGRRVFVRLWVKVRKDWRNDPGTLRRLGLH
jgi:GTP-binding protein Era